MVRLFHIALAGDWAAAQRHGAYAVSTLGRTLDDVGFIHLSFPHQVNPTAEAFYAGRDDLVLLELDAARMSSPVRLEQVGDSHQRFPHLYGPLLLEEVVAVHAFAREANGDFPVIS